MQVRITSHGLERIERNLIASAGRARYIQPALEAVAEDMIEVTKVQFQSQGRRGGGSWQRLKPSTVERKLFYGYDPRILYGTHRLIESLTERGDVEMILEIDHNSVRFGSSVPYADVHQHGGGRNIPARPFIHFLESDYRNWRRIITAYIADPLKRHGG